MNETNDPMPTGAQPSAQGTSREDVIAFLREALARAEQSARAREDSARIAEWEPTEEELREGAVAVTRSRKRGPTREERQREAAKERRIAAKYRREAALYQAAIALLEGEQAHGA